MKSCLKRTPARPPCGPRSVSFRDGEDNANVHLADEWDRSPVDVVSKLTYEYVLLSLAS